MRSWHLDQPITAASELPADLLFYLATARQDLSSCNFAPTTRNSTRARLSRLPSRTCLPLVELSHHLSSTWCDCSRGMQRRSFKARHLRARTVDGKAATRVRCCEWEFTSGAAGGPDERLSYCSNDQQRVRDLALGTKDAGSRRSCGSFVQFVLCAPLLQVGTRVV
jgi:hypothetical protein